MGRIKRVQVVVPTTGGAGVATGEERAGIPGGIARLVGLQVDYNGAAPGTTDVTIMAQIGAVVKTLLTLTDNNADWPMRQVLEVAYDEAGAALAVAADIPNRVHPVCQGNLVVAVAECDALTPAVTVDAVFEVI